MSRRPDPRPARTRATILRATQELISERGVEATTIAAVADRASVAIGSIYTHFINKERLLAALIDMQSEHPFVQMRSAREELGPVDRIVALGEAVVQFSADEPGLIRSLLGGQVDPEPTSDVARGGASSALAVHVDGAMLDLKHDLAEAMAAGELATVPVDVTATMLVCLWSGVGAGVARGDRFRLTQQDGQAVLRQALSLLA